ncbi:hypothetical protein PS2_077 [Serratia phage PS2]|uniref:Uncharacterized protein n=1 Tax=Serratia phage PS2 TaxID=1481112 RepID=A0A023W4R7_9CAUD|nr:hypothetical protein FF83_gp077 [Serratia phage PS2]AHY25324.1 hypothetical protein PS2_077 [Serratia phage PS2]
MKTATGFESAWILTWQDWEQWDDVSAFSFYECTLRKDAFTEEELKSIKAADADADHLPTVNIVLDKKIIEVVVDGVAVVTKPFFIVSAEYIEDAERTARILDRVESALPTGLEGFED